MITADKLRALLVYDPDTGHFWRKSTGRRVADLPRSGYFAVYVDKKRYSAHRLAWLYMTGKWPEAEIDHIDRDKHNNVFANLRECTREQNAYNLPPLSNNKCGIKGVFRYKHGSWGAHIRANGRTMYLGSFGTMEQAVFVRREAEAKYHGQFAQQAY